MFGVVVVSAAIAMGGALTAVAAASGAAASGAAARTVDVTIGDVTTLSGPAAQYGESTVAGAQEAIQEINSNGGVKTPGLTYKFALANYDDQGLPADGVAQFKKGLSSGETLFIGPLFGTVSTALISALRGAPAIMTITGGPINGSLLATDANAYQTQLDPAGEAAAVLWWAKQHKYTTVAMIVDSTSTFDSSTFPSAVQAGAASYGVRVVKIISTSGPTQTDYSSQLLALASVSPDAVISAQTGAPNALIVKQAREAGDNWPIICTSGAPTLEYGIAGSSINGTFDIVGETIPVEAAAGLAQAKKLESIYATENHGAVLSDPGGTYSNAYTAVYAYARAIASAGTATNVKKLEAALDTARLASLPQVVRAKYIAQRGAMATLYDVQKAAQPRVEILIWRNGSPVGYATYKG